MTGEWVLRWRAALAAWRAPRSLREYLAHRRRSRPPARSSDGVVVCSLCSIPSVIHTYAELVPRFARESNSRVEAFLFHRSPRPDPLVASVFYSFGVRRIVTAHAGVGVRQQCARRAAGIFSSLRSRADLASLREGGVLLGDLIYDTYLRDLYEATVDIRDPRLLSYIEDALVFLRVAEDYFRKNRVEAVFVDHLVYIWQGVLGRVAMRRGVPLYTVYFDPRPSAQRVDTGAREDGLDFPVRFNHWLFPAVFSRLSAQEQSVAREEGLAYIRHRVSGGIQSNVLPGQSAYAPAGGARILSDSTAPKILVLLHDFCDAVHVYRSLLFDDFHDWIQFLLAKASDTPFEWYVKPHPNMNDYRRRGITNANQRVIEELRFAHPRVRFLDSSVSNKQLVDEGIAAVFTMYGTAAHEFPFLGVPAVCGADNPHSAYPFAHTPATRDEYAGLIARAGALGPVRGADRIPEFCYMNFLHAARTLTAGAPIFDPVPGPGASADEVWESARRAAGPRADQALDDYVRGVLGGSIPSCIR